MRMGSVKSDLQAGEEVGGGGFGRGSEDEGGDAGGGKEAAAVVPDAGVVECPEEAADGEHDDEGDGDAAEDLELGVHAARVHVVGRGEVVLAQEEGLPDVDQPHGEPAEGGDDDHEDDVAGGLFDVGWDFGNKGKDDEDAGEKKDGACGATQVGLQAPAELTGGDLFPFEETEEDEVQEVGHHQSAAEHEDDEKPTMLLVHDLHDMHSHAPWRV
jgi:hypothetical protein